MGAFCKGRMIWNCQYDPLGSTRESIDRRGKAWRRVTLASYKISPQSYYRAPVDRIAQLTPAPTASVRCKHCLRASDPETISVANGYRPGSSIDKFGFVKFLIDILGIPISCRPVMPAIDICSHPAPHRYMPLFIKSARKEVSAASASRSSVPCAPQVSATTPCPNSDLTPSP